MEPDRTPHTWRGVVWCDESYLEYRHKTQTRSEELLITE